MSSIIDYRIASIPGNLLTLTNVLVVLPDRLTVSKTSFVYKCIASVEDMATSHSSDIPPSHRDPIGQGELSIDLVACHQCQISSNAEQKSETNSHQGSVSLRLVSLMTRTRPMCSYDNVACQAPSRTLLQMSCIQSYIVNFS